MSRPLTWVERRAIVLDRAGYECADCGGTATEADHMWPRKHGGTDEFDNLQALCRSCNASKGDTILVEHLTPSRCSAAAAGYITEAATLLNQAVRFFGISDLLNTGCSPREAHDAVGNEPAHYPVDASDLVRGLILKYVGGDGQAPVPAELPDNPVRRLADLFFPAAEGSA